MKEKVRWAVVGAGRIAHTFCQDIVWVDNAEVVAVAARQKVDATAFAQQYGIARAYQGYQAAFDDPEVDAVYIATPHTFHHAQTAQALVAGKHVMCEKPFTVSSSECEHLISLATQKQRYLMEAMWTWFLPAIKQAKTWVDEGRIGELVQIQADFGYPIAYSPDKREYNAALAGGCLLEMGIYPVALMQLFLPQGPDTLVVSGTRAPNGVEDHLNIQMTCGNVGVALATSFRARLSNMAYLVGTEGYLCIPDFFRASSCSLHVLDECIERFDDHRKGSGFEYQIAASSADILCGKLASEVVPLSQSLVFQRRMEDILKVFATVRPA